MLQITLDEFRCWKHLDIKIPSSEITLLKGNSGVGKTTILQAITWCLYGNTRSVHPNHLEKAKTKVSVSSPQFMIIRKKNPNRLLLTQESITYEDKVAQSMINNLFGNCDTWMSSCYIIQGCRNVFLTSPNSGKMELLNSIAFHEEDPSEFIEKIDNIAKEADYEYQSNLKRFNENLLMFNTMISSIDTTKALSDIQVEEINHKIKFLLGKIKELETVRAERNVGQNILDKLSLQLSKIKPVVIPEPDRELKQLQEKYGDVEDIICLLNKRDMLLTNLRNIFVDPKLSNNYTSEDYQNAARQEIIYLENLNSVKKLGIGYDQESINSLIQTLKDMLSSQEYLKLKKEKEKLQSQIVHVDLSPRAIPKPDMSKYDTSELFSEVTVLSTKDGLLQSDIQHLKKGLDVIQCPKCDEPLRYNFGKLSLADTLPSDREELALKEKELKTLTKQIIIHTEKIKSVASEEIRERNRYEQEIQKEQKRLNLLQIESDRNEELKLKLNQITEQLEHVKGIEGKILTNQEISQYQIAIAKLETIVITSEPEISSNHIQKCLNNGLLLTQKMLLEGEYSEFLKTIPERFRSESLQSVRDYSNKIKNYNKTVQTLIDEKTQSEKFKKSLQEQISTIVIPEDPSDQIKSLTEEKDCFLNYLKENEEAQKVIVFHEKVMKERERIVALNEELASLNLLKLRASETECKVLQQVVDGINGSIQSICGSLFDRDMLITLNLFKTLKTTQNAKPSVNFSIAYQGGIFDSINQLSGGEGDRVSLAFTLALNRLSSCPILMLDESLSSLDLTMKESTIRTIMENTNSTVIIVMHDGIEGLFHNVIDLDENSNGRY